MATLTVISDVLPKWQQWREAGVRLAYFNGTGSDVTQVKAASDANKAWVVVGGRVSLQGSGAFLFLSSDTEVDRLEYAARATAKVAKGIQCSDGKSLTIQNSDARPCHGWIAYVLLGDNESCPVLF